jgi:riboflavin synthase
MFTGLIETVATVEGMHGKSLRVDLALLAPEVEIGDSIAVNGTCLTVADRSSSVCVFDVSGETAARTTLGQLRNGDQVNVERALRVSDRIGGHFVTGHVDGVGVIERVTRDALEISLPGELIATVIEKGSIAVDGISLTVASLSSTGFTAAIVPHTFSNTNLRDRKTGDRANIETDVLGKYVKRFMHPEQGGITLADLEKHGFAGPSAGIRQ